VNEALQATILQQQQALESLRDSERRYRALIELAPDAIVTLDWRGRVSSANGVTCGIHGYTPEEVVGKPFWKLGVFRAQDIPKYLRLFASLLRGKPMAPIELVCLSKDGTEVVIECRASVMRNGDKLAGLQLIARNVTELKKAEQALRESEHTLRATLESTADGILVVMEGGKVKHFNERFVRMWGFAAEVTEARDEALLLKAAAAQLQDPQALLSRGGGLLGTAGQESDVLHFKDGRIFERFSCPLVRDGREVGRVSSYRDVTAKRQAERLAAIGEMVTGLAHENRNAMQRMQACLEMLALEVQDRPEALDLLNRMQAAQDRLHHLHEAVREYAAPIVLKCEPIRLEQVVREAWRHLESSSWARTVQFHCCVEQAAACVDRLAVESVFRNIFENSLAACRDPVEIDVRSGPSTLNERAATEIVVRDNGPGLDPQQQARIFEPFYTTKTQGTGLGMAISRRLIEAHGGRIAARAAPAGGAEIVITLPRQ
jgi:PAS domain S-box-containing protein